MRNRQTKKTTTHPHRTLRAVLRADRSGSAWAIGLALAIAPAMILFDPLRDMVWLVRIGVIGLALWLAALGVLMAWGLTRSVVRGEELPNDWWMSMIDPR